MQARAILFTAINQVSVEQIDVPEPEVGEVLLQAVYTLISPGTELRCRAGKQQGAVFPFIPGYSFVGRVIANGVGTTLKPGTLVFCSGTARASVHQSWGGHCSLAVRSEQDVYILPKGVDPLWGAGAKLAAIAYRGLRLSQAKPHENVAVIGLGAIGQLAARIHALSGARVIGADLSPVRVAVAQQAGIEAIAPQDGLAEAFANLLPGGADVVVDATGAPSVLPAAIQVARAKAWDDSPAMGARIIIQGSYPADFCIPYSLAFMKELSFWVPRDVQPGDIHTVLGLMARGKLNLDGLISAVRPPEAASETYAELAEAHSPLITAAFRWGE